MIVDNTAGLQMRVDRDAAEVLETAYFQVASHLVGQPVADWNNTFFMAMVQRWSFSGKPPDICGEADEFPAIFPKAPRVLNNSLDFAAETNHARRII